MEYFIFIGSIIAMIIIAKVFSYPFKMIFKFLLNICFGILLLVFTNIVGQSINLHINFNCVTALISGTLGIPGVVLLIILNYII